MLTLPQCITCPFPQEPADLAATSEDEASSDEEGPLDEPNPHQALVPIGSAATKKWVPNGCCIGDSL